MKSARAESADKAGGMRIRPIFVVVFLLGFGALVLAVVDLMDAPAMTVGDVARRTLVPIAVALIAAAMAWQDGEAKR